MHELGIANSVLEAVRVELGRHPGASPVRVAVRVGELAAIDPQALAFSFQALTAGTEWENVPLDIQTLPRLHHCPACGITFRVIEYGFVCPGCGESRTRCVGGDELELAYLELEEA